MRCEADILEFGYKYHMNDVCATVGLSNLQKFNWIVERQRDNAEYYNRELQNFPGIKLIQQSTDRKSSYWLYTILVEDRAGFCRLMGEKGIMVSRVHERNDKHTCTIQFQTELNSLESVIHRMICIPVGWWVKDEDREYIVESIKKGW
jgi:dTDP-4-amino-4,6-dideoxygalactose transaminase